MVIIPQQIQISNHYDVHLKLMQYNDVNYTSIKKILRGTTTKKKKNWKTGQKTSVGNSQKDVKMPSHI